MNMDGQVNIGIIGAGFLADTRARCYRRVAGARANILAVASRSEASASDYAARQGIPQVYASVEALLANPEIDMVDLCVPNRLHRPLTEAAAQAGKHIVCTKPLTAYVGQDLGDAAALEQVAQVDRRQMLETVLADAQAMIDAAAQAGVQLMYGENWLYAPSICKAESLLAASAAPILELRGGECHSGSHSPYSKQWQHTGGGAMLRLGAHALGAMLYLKAQEGLRRHNRPIRPSSIMAETGDTTQAMNSDLPNKWIATGWQDVENWATMLISFEDGSRAIVYASDNVLGGMESDLQIMTARGQLKCNLSPNNLLQAYAPEADVYGSEYIMEKIDTSAGWTTPMPDEDWTSGHQAMCDDFVQAVAKDVPAKARGELGLEVLRVVYAGYLSAATGQRVSI